jgi:FHA domain
MTRCAQCDAECPADGAPCAGCGAVVYDAGPPTAHTRPRLVRLITGARPAGQCTPPTAVMPALPPPPVLPRLTVIRGLKVNSEYPLYEGDNLIGRSDDRPVDIDLCDQEPRDRVWASRNHAVVRVAAGVLTVEDLNSLNGTYVNRNRVYPGRPRPLALNDVLQIGTIQLKVTL